MSEVAKFKLDDARFRRAFSEYVKHTSRTFMEAVNAKAFFVARKAIWFTEKASKQGIKQSLGEVVRVSKMTRTGKTRFSRQLKLTQGTQHAAPLAALIINARRGRKGTRGLYGSAMTAAIRELLAARDRSVAYIKSGWLNAVRTLSPYVKGQSQAAPMDVDSRQIGKPKGSAKPDQGGSDVHVAAIINEAWAKRDKKNSLDRVGGKGLQKAFDDEAASMEQYIKDKMQPGVDQFNRSQR